MQWGGGGAKLSRKRSAEGSSAQPAGRCCRVEALLGSVAGSLGQCDSMWGTANVAGLGGGSCSVGGHGGAEIAEEGRRPTPNMLL